MISYTKFLSTILISIFFPISFYFASGKPKNEKISDVKFSEKFVPIEVYSNEEILDFEQNTKIKLPKLVKDIYTGELNIKNLIFNNTKNKNIIITKLYSLEKIKETFMCHGIKTPGYIMPPSLNSVIFAENNYYEYIFAGDDCIWLYDHEYNRCTHKFTIS